MENKQLIESLDKNMKPLVSVIMPIYNAEKYVEEAIESILNQTMSDFELILIDDGSVDGTRKIVEDYSIKEGRIRPVYNETNIGLVDSLNKGIELASGRYIARMDGDDISTSDRFENQIRFLENNSLDIVGGQCSLFCEDIDDSKDLDYPVSSDICQRFLRQSNALAHPAWLGKRELFTKIRYRQIKACEDYDFLIRAVNLGYRIGNTDSKVLYYRLNPNGVSIKQAAHQNVVAKYLSKCYREKSNLEYRDYECWISSLDYSRSVMREKKYLDKLNRAKESRYKVIVVLGIISNPIWIRQRFVRLINMMLIRLDRM